VGQVDLVEDAAIGEMGFLGLGPAAEDVVDRDEFDLRKLRRVLGGSLGRARPVEILTRDVLALVGVEIFR